MDVPPEDHLRNQENQPLLDEGIGMYSEDLDRNDEPEYITEYGDGTESAQRAQRPNGATVLCRVCDVAVSLEGRNQQHVVKCHSCDEATPIRPAPPGKKYVRCPCNCLLICKASSTRIACPRNNCRRVITLAGQRDPGTAIRAPTGSCRVKCNHCNEIFLFNTLTNALANCPHCKKYSTVGSFARRRALLFFILAATVAVLAVILTMLTNASTFNKIYMVPILIGLYGCALYTAYKSFNYYTCRKSEIIGPVEGFDNF
ncbi:Phosphatidylinositol-4,5-bisphosphate 4-phosphatase [Caenorhabditis elegans]|uniref:Phosphatidylinositol-4,5-bisphosphate 4-phosphatase n=2 Tax=Caenorhabditis elegans TaxID=6239 RepID=A0ACB0DPY6_CAEEL|nr:Phosphatidylinositol-4,5-bisphosphate 4-phosphatase [Caenorhabditis elegans]CAI9651045.1 Phosphatidylinositol-4,5-bisphosphate 4-phosphatase [Caenorhabditis elegans]